VTASHPSYETDPRVDDTGHDNKTAKDDRLLPRRLHQRASLTAMLEEIITNNRAGGWRKLKARNTAR